MSESAIREALAGLDGWELSGREIVKRFQFPSFPAAVAFLVQVACLAERQDHHPDLLVQYDQVRLSVGTHSAGGVTEKDLALARAVEALLGR
jgi:4a-hydroxytetrahydrobiopterin dehydratase